VTENLDLVRSIYAKLNDAYATGNVEAWELAAFSHPNVVLRPSGMFPETGEYHGHDGVRKFTENQAQAFAWMRVEPHEYIEAGHRIVVPIRVGGKARHTGIETTFDVVHVWTLSSGKVSEIAMFRTRAEAFRAIGLEE
jgi:ketosteroid isomerase-like protein